MANYKVTTKGSILPKKGDLKLPGQTISSEEIGNEKSELEFIAHGKIVNLESRSDRKAHSPAPENSIVPKQTKFVVGTDGEITEQENTKVEVIREPDLFEKRPQTLTSAWEFNPADLHGKSLEELNVMIMERNPAIQPYDDRAEAIAQLSQDYKGS